MPTGDSRVIDRHPGDAHLAGDHRRGILVLRQVVRRTVGVGDHQRGRRGTSTRPAGALDVVRRPGRHVSHHDRLQVTDVDAEFERRRTRQHVHLAVDELPLNLRCLLGIPLRGMLLGAQRSGVHGLVHHSVVVGVVVDLGQVERLQRADAPAVRTDPAHRVRRQRPTRVAQEPRAGPPLRQGQPGVVQLEDRAQHPVGLHGQILAGFEELPAALENRRGGSRVAQCGEHLVQEHDSAVGGPRPTTGIPADDLPSWRPIPSSACAPRCCAERTARP